MTNGVERGPILSDACIAQCGERVATYDRENRCFSGLDLPDENAVAGAKFEQLVLLPRHDTEGLS
jgi:hypothetical protein